MTFQFQLPHLPWPRADIDAAMDEMRCCTDPKRFEVWLQLLEYGATYLPAPAVGRLSQRLADDILKPSIELVQAGPDLQRMWSVYYGLQALAVKCGVMP
jgi:hypothetical protein